APRDFPIAAALSASASSRSARARNSRLSAGIPATWLNRDGGLTPSFVARLASVSASRLSRAAISSAAAMAASPVSPARAPLARALEKAVDFIGNYLRILDVRIMPRTLDNEDLAVQVLSDRLRLRPRIIKIRVIRAHYDQNRRAHLPDPRRARRLV